MATVVACEYRRFRLLVHADIPVGKRPGGVAVSRDGSVANTGEEDGTVSVIYTCNPRRPSNTTGTRAVCRARPVWLRRSVNRLQPPEHDDRPESQAAHDEGAGDRCGNHCDVQRQKVDDRQSERSGGEHADAPRHRGAAE
jgi:hypothetical protein